jgi:hypothetical protein
VVKKQKTTIEQCYGDIKRSNVDNYTEIHVGGIYYYINNIIKGNSIKIEKNGDVNLIYIQHDEINYSLSYEYIISKNRLSSNLLNKYQIIKNNNNYKLVIDNTEFLVDDNNLIIKENNKRVIYISKNI